MLGEVPLALLSFSTKGSGTHPDADKAVAALRSFASAIEFLIDGELRVTALSPLLPTQNGGGGTSQAAPTCSYSDLDAIALQTYSATHGLSRIGPVQAAKPISDLSRGASVEDIVDTASLLLAMSLPQQG